MNLMLKPKIARNRVNEIMGSLKKTRQLLFYS